MSGICQLGEDIGIDAATDVSILVLCWKLGAKAKPGHIMEQEWLEGMEALGTDSTDKVRNYPLQKIHNMRTDVFLEVITPPSLRLFFYCLVYFWYCRCASVSIWCMLHVFSRRYSRPITSHRIASHHVTWLLFVSSLSAFSLFVCLYLFHVFSFCRFFFFFFAVCVFFFSFSFRRLVEMAAAVLRPWVHGERRVPGVLQVRVPVF